MSRAQTFTLLACLTLVAMMIFTPVSGRATAPATTVGDTVRLRSEQSVVAVSSEVVIELLEQEPAIELADLRGGTEPWLAPVASSHFPRPSSIQEGRSEFSSSSTPCVRLDGLFLSS